LHITAVKSQKFYRELRNEATKKSRNQLLSVSECGSIPHGIPMDDEKMAEFYKNFLAEMIEREGGVSLDVEPQFQLLDRQPERVLGIGVYIFKNGTGHPIETIWDFRQAEIPRFQYNGNKLTQTTN